MAEEIYMSIKSDVKSATQDTQEYANTLKGAKDNVKEVNEQLSIQNRVIIDLEKELLRLQQIQDSIPKGAFYAGQPKLTEDIRKVTAELKAEKLGLKDLKQQQKEATNQIKEFNQAQKETGASLLEDIKNFKVFGISINGIAGGFKKIIPIAKLAFATITRGLISTGIGAVVVAFGTFIAYLTQTKKGAELLQRVFAGIGATFKVVIDRVSGIGEGIAQIFSGDRIEGLKTIGRQFAGIGEEIAKESKLAIQLKADLQALVDSERELSVETANRRAEVEELRLKSEDLTLTDEERLEALEKANEIESELMDKRVANAEEAVRIQTEQMAKTKNLQADLQKLADLEIKLANIRRESNRRQQTVEAKANTIRRRREQQEKAAQKRFIRRQNERIKKQNEVVRAFNKLAEDQFVRAIKDEEKQELFLAKQRFEAREKEIEKNVFDEKKKEKLLIQNFTLFEIEKADIKKKFSDEEEEKRKAEAETLKNIQNEALLLNIEDEKKRRDEDLRIQEEAELKAAESLTNSEEVQQAIRDKFRAIEKNNREQDAEEKKELNEAVAAAALSTARQGLSLATEIAGKGSKVGKAIAVADATISGVQGVQNAFTTAQKSPVTAVFPAYPIVQAGLAAAFSAVQIKKILNSQPPSAGGGGGGGASAGGGGGQGLPSGQMMGGGFTLEDTPAPEPVKAFVVTDEMTSSQNQLANIRRRSTI